MDWLWWLMCVTPAGLEAEMGGLKFETSLSKKKKVRETLGDSISKNKLSMVVHACGPSYLGGSDRRIMVRGKSETLSEN
jgi:hypothetical protein